ncbi:hypothetical protein ACFSKW_45995 [Nonomuraea mangrovi]|uniref:Uncharacterized protein n=1 Tax=Nonomuraea mangrovi TaxID=2316207 RepID=A0ABW4T9Y4_9ACTN
MFTTLAEILRAPRPNRSEHGLAIRRGQSAVPETTRPPGADAGVMDARDLPVGELVAGVGVILEGLLAVFAAGGQAVEQAGYFHRSMPPV